MSAKKNNGQTKCIQFHCVYVTFEHGKTKPMRTTVLFSDFHLHMWAYEYGANQHFECGSCSWAELLKLLSQTPAPCQHFEKRTEKKTADWNRKRIDFAHTMPRHKLLWNMCVVVIARSLFAGRLPMQLHAAMQCEQLILHFVGRFCFWSGDIYYYYVHSASATYRAGFESIAIWHHRLETRQCSKFKVVFSASGFRSQTSSLLHTLIPVSGLNDFGRVTNWFLPTSVLCLYSLKSIFQ